MIQLIFLRSASCEDFKPEFPGLQLTVARNLVLGVLMCLIGLSSVWPVFAEPAAGETNNTTRSDAGVVAPLLKLNVLRPNDVVWVKVYQEEDLETKAAIDKDGFITMPLLGPVQVGQKTVEEATGLIRSLYAKDYLVNPRVSVTLIERARLRFTVMGQVQRPGTYEFPDNESLNLLQAIAMAGGYTRLGAPSKVGLQRMQDGKPVLIPLNAEQMSKDKQAKPFELMPDDIITVGERIF
jgi:polysaccharide export outer membrane protein